MQHCMIGHLQVGAVCQVPRIVEPVFMQRKRRSVCECTKARGACDGKQIAIEQSIEKGFRGERVKELALEEPNLGVGVCDLHVCFVRRSGDLHPFDRRPP